MLSHVLLAGKTRRLVLQPAGLYLPLLFRAQLSNFGKEMNHVPHFKDVESA